ncbi:hypothetical protein [Pseudomonas cedrina]|uniref:hypothetical protein n=1 Tax=Pseudomonas cedrina TaxID=651740 RepID=UPI0012FE48E3|nr:hypothetical protein [Pseudomonas cedrina]
MAKTVPFPAMAIPEAITCSTGAMSDAAGNHQRHFRHALQISGKVDEVGFLG